MDVYPRKVCFLPESGKAMVKRLAPTNTDALVAQDTRRGATGAVPASTGGGSVGPVLTASLPGGRSKTTWPRPRVDRGGRLRAGAQPPHRDHQPAARHGLRRRRGRPARRARDDPRTSTPTSITLDVEMPRMDGIDFLSKLMRLRPMPVVMVSTLTERGAEVTMKALELGAVDFVAEAEDRHGRRPAPAGRGHHRQGAHRLEGAPSASTHAPGPRGAGRPAPPRGATRRSSSPAVGGPAVDREDHLHRRLHRRHRGHQGSAGQPATGLPGGLHHPAHAAGFHQELRGAPGRPVPHQREGSAGRRAHPARPRATSRRAACT